MKFFIPPELLEPWRRATERIPRADLLAFDALTTQIDELRRVWLEAHPGWAFERTAFESCLDHSPSPAYDLVLVYRRPLTEAELADQTRDREAYIARKEAEYERRAVEQAEVLARVLASLD